MATGMEWALQAVLKSLDLDPEQVKLDLAKTVQIIVSAEARLTRIEQNQVAIMRHLGIAQGIENDRALPTGPSVEHVAADARGAILANGRTIGADTETGN